MIAAAVALAAAVADPAPRSGTFAIAAVVDTLDPLTWLGPLKAGMICLPAGTLRWRDVARPARDELLARLRRALEAAGAPMALPIGGAEAAARYRITATIDAADLKACVPGLGIGEMRARGKGSLTVRWQVRDMTTQAVVASAIRSEPLNLAGRDPRHDATVLGDALTASAAAFGGGELRALTAPR